MADNFGSQFADAFANQQRIGIADRAQQFQEDAARKAEAEGHIKQLMDFAGKTVQAALDAGNNPMTIAGAVQPLIESAASIAGDTYGPEGADRVHRMGQALLATPRPGIPQIPGITSPSPTGVTPTPSVSPAPQVSADVPSGTPAPPGQNLTQPNETGYRVDYGPTIGREPTAPTPPSSALPDPNTLARALLQLPRGATAAQKEGITKLLDASIKEQVGGNIEVKTLKDSSGGDHIVFIDKAKRQAFGPDGQPYAPNPQTDDDISAVAKAIESGRQPPVTTGLYRKAAAVKAQLERDGFDLSTANIEWQRAQSQVKSLNSQRMIQYAGLADSVIKTIDETKRLAFEMDNSGIQFANRAKMEAYAQLNGNSPQGQLVGRYIAAVNTLREEFANLANGGYAPTESAWTLANQQINGNYGVKMLTASLNEVQRLIRYRVSSIPNLGTLGAGGANRYTGAASPPVEQSPAEPQPVERNFFHGKKFRFEAIPNGG